MNLTEIVEGLQAFLKMVEQMPDRNLKTLVFGLAAACGLWRIPEMITAIRWW